MKWGGKGGEEVADSTSAGTTVAVRKAALLALPTKARILCLDSL